MSIEKEFVPYQEALALKELGFNEPCFGFYERDKELVIQECEITDFHFDSLQCVAPTFSQAFRWFREKYELIYVIIKAESWFFTINGCNTQEGFNTYDEAELACLKKLIEIVQEGNK